MVSYRPTTLVFAFFLSVFFNVVDFSTTLAGGGNTDEEKLAVILTMYQSYKKNFPGVADISTADARTLLKQDKILFIDARKPEEQAVSILPGAITSEEFLEKPDVPEGKTAVVYCTVGYRSGMLARNIGRQETKVMNLAGGILAWALDGGKVYREGKEIKRIHVFGKEWNYPPDGYDPVYFGFWGPNPPINSLSQSCQIGPNYRIDMSINLIPCGTCFYQSNCDEYFLPTD